MTNKYDLWVEKAISFCTRRLGKNKQEITKMLREGDCYVHSAFRYAIAREISAHLKSRIRGVKGVYVYGSTMTNQAKMYSDIDMLVHIDEKQEEVEELIKKLEEGILESYFTILCNKMCSALLLLDVHIIDTESIEKRQGYAALVTSLVSPPLKI
jgi:predicted nucleotidyltransferase